MITANENLPLFPLQEAFRKVTGRQYCRQAVHGWRKAKKLKCVKVGREWLTSLDEVRKMIERETEAAST